jgi:hypothetical protein
MAAHWTYCTFEAGSDLRQGDLIAPTKEVRAVLDEVHPHFLDAKYRAFMVLTQTCDLVRGRGFDPCKSPYVNLAAVRVLGDVLPGLLDRACDRVKVRKRSVPGLYYADSRSKAEMLLARIVNQNEQALGLFYLHPDADVRIAEPCVALLQVSIALRAREHYEALVDARSGRLDPTFQCKLGWLTGNLFSRVATRDWTNRGREDLAKQFLHEHASSPSGLRWAPRESVEEAGRSGVDVSGMTADEAFSTIIGHRPKTAKETAIDRMVAILEDVALGIDTEDIKKVRDRLASDSLLEAALGRNGP